jgi:hypothetical protein
MAFGGWPGDQLDRIDPEDRDGFLNLNKHADDDPVEARQLRHGAKRSPAASCAPEGDVSLYLSIPNTPACPSSDTSCAAGCDEPTTGSDAIDSVVVPLQRPPAEPRRWRRRRA